jgi:hypothetical protein
MSDKMWMTVQKMEEAFSRSAFYGLGLPYGKTSETSFDEFDAKTMENAASICAHKGNGHESFTEIMGITWNINAPRYFWQEFDRYRVGVSKISESTMHTIMRRPLTQDNFNRNIPDSMLIILNGEIQSGCDIVQVKNMLPEGFLQRRVVFMNYRAMAHIMRQRMDHRLDEWKLFIASILTHSNHRNLLMLMVNQKEASND